MSSSLVTLERATSPTLARACTLGGTTGTPWPIPPWTIVVWVALVTWFAVVFAIARSQFLDFDFGRFDLGNMVQAVWSTAHGRPWRSRWGSPETSCPALPVTSIRF